MMSLFERPKLLKFVSLKYTKSKVAKLVPVKKDHIKVYIASGTLNT